MGCTMLRALDSLGVARELVDIGAPIEQIRFRTVPGDVVATQPSGVPLVDGLPPMAGVTRPNLHRVLAEAAEAAGATIRMPATWTSIRDEGDGVHVELNDHSEHVVDLVVAADGVASKVRRTFFPDAPEPQYVGQAAWRARVPRRGEPLLDLYYGAQTKPGIVTVSAEHAYIFALVTVADFQRLEREDFPDLLRAELAPFGGPIAEVRDEILDPHQIHYSPLTPILVPPPWHRGRVLLVGDAAHATTPHLAYGAGLAVEDGVVLGDVVGAATTVEEALEQFNERRFERCRMIVENGVQLSRWEQHPDDPDADAIGLIGQSHGALLAPI
jgi:2-polyprenyl-6-methoxyphenol hydroxylase-like FAD-dependent oxidoreductase